MANFDYINKFDGLEELGRLCAEAEKNQETEPKLSADYCRNALETICSIIANREGIDVGPNATLSVMLDTEKMANHLSQMELYQPIRYARRRCNTAINLGEDLGGMPYVVESLYHIVGTALVNMGYMSEIPTFAPLGGHFEIPAEGELL